MTWVKNMSELTNKIDVLENLYAHDSPNIEISNLASMLKISQKQLADALDLDASTVSRKEIGTNNKALRKWMIVFNLLIDLIKKTEPELARDKIQLKMNRWLKHPNSHFGNEAPLDLMLKGKARRVINLLEQLSS